MQTLVRPRVFAVHRSPPAHGVAGCTTFQTVVSMMATFHSRGQFTSLRGPHAVLTTVRWTRKITVRPEPGCPRGRRIQHQHFEARPHSVRGLGVSGLKITVRASRRARRLEAVSLHHASWEASTSTPAAVFDNTSAIWLK